MGMFEQDKELSQKDCCNGFHNFIPIASFLDTRVYDVEHIIRWCSKCGAVKKEQRMDGRVLESKTVHYTPET